MRVLELENSYIQVFDDSGFEIDDDNPFNFPLPEGKRIGKGQTDKNGNRHPILIDVHRLKVEFYIEQERRWRNSELALTDKFLIHDYPITTAQKEKVIEYRSKLRDFQIKPTFENAEDYSAWRPVWPESVPRPTQ